MSHLRHWFRSDVMPVLREFAGWCMTHLLPVLIIVLVALFLCGLLDGLHWTRADAPTELHPQRIAALIHTHRGR